MHLQAIVAVCLSIVHPLLCYDERMNTSVDPILEYLKMDPNHVRYEVVPVLHRVHNRSPKNSQPSQIHFKAFGKSYKLSLKPTEGLFNSNKHVPMWAITRNDSNPDGLDFEDITEASADVGDIYQDPTTMSSILLYYDNTGQLQVVSFEIKGAQDQNGLFRLSVETLLSIIDAPFIGTTLSYKEGTVGSDLIVRPLPVRVLKQVMDKTEDLYHPDLLPDVTSRERRSLRLTNHHVVIKRSSQSLDSEYSDFMLMEPDHLAKRLRRKSPIGVRSENIVPHVIYPEIMCIIDYDTYRLHGGNDARIKRYFMVFWNAVDLRYKVLKNPEVRLNIAGIIISKDRAATPFLEISDRDAVNVHNAMAAMSKYLYAQKRIPVADITITITKLDLCGVNTGESVCRRSLTGMARFEGACSVSDYFETVGSIGIVEDTGGFSGIIAAAHELGHLFGAVHDGSPPPSGTDGPGAVQCPWDDGYIMSYIRKNENAFKWSPCSVKQFRLFLKSDTAAKCLYNVPQNLVELPKVLPGTLLSLDQQCEKDHGTKKCNSSHNPCILLFCVNPRVSGGCIASRSAAEGSPCGNGRHCISGSCIDKH